MNDNILIGAIGTAYLDMFKQFLLENGFAHVDDNGNVTTGKITFEKFYEIHEKFAEFLKENKQALEEAENTDSRPVIKATTHKPKAVMIERSKAGRKLHDKNALSRLYDTGGTVTTKNKGKKDKKDIDSVVSLSIQEVKEWTAHIPADKTLTRFDLEVLNVAVTLFEAGNMIVTADMIFRILTGGKTQEPTQAMREEIYDSLFRLCCTGIVIDATDEFNAGYNGKKEFRGTLLPCGMVIGDTILNGQPVHDCIKIYDKSPLVEYARAKKQISNIPLDMRNIQGINGTKENIMLLGYLIGRYTDMVNNPQKIKPVISYEKLYDYLGVEGKTPQIIRNKKAKIRATVRAILSAWVEKKYIKGFQELTEDDNPAKERIPAAKIWLVLFTKKEFDAIHNSEILLPIAGD